MKLFSNDQMKYLRLQRKRRHLYTILKKLKCKYRPVSKITLSRKCAQLFQIYQRCDFKWHTKKPTSPCIIYTNLNKFLNEKFVVYKLPFPHSIKYIHLSGQKIFYRAKWRTGFGKKCYIILTAKGQTFAHSR